MPRLTLTGWFWILAPWGLLLAKRLSFSLMELWIWILAWSITAGSVVSVLKPAGAGWQNYAVLLYAAFHFHCMLFSAVLYDWKGTKGQSARRTANVLISQFLIATVAVGMALMARMH
jgi:hypothetical protein